MTFSYQMTGTMTITGCGNPSKTYNVLYRFAERSIVYLCYKAQKGILEAIWIKSVILVNKGGIYIPIYKDNLNAVYMEDELCTQTDAVNAATAYLQGQINAIDSQLNRFCP
jgi:hypothetical protein